MCTRHLNKHIGEDMALVMYSQSGHFLSDKKDLPALIKRSPWTLPLKSPQIAAYMRSCYDPKAVVCEELLPALM